MGKRAKLDKNNVGGDVEPASANPAAGKGPEKRGTAADVAVKTTEAAERPSKKAKASAKEIDGLFGQLKDAKKTKVAVKEKSVDEAAAINGPTKKASKLQGSKDDIFGANTGNSRGKTEEGFSIYSEEELGLGKQAGGGTPQCPFDCECCY